MEVAEALEILRKLADGLNPDLGTPIANDDLLKSPQIIRALHCATAALEFQQERERARRSLPANAGKPWSAQEDAQICEEVRRGVGFQEIATLHSRTAGSIVARLIRLGKISAGGSSRKTA